MLDFALKHRKSLDLLSADRDNGLRSFELKPDEWKIVGQLRDVLKVGLRDSAQSCCHHADVPLEIFLDATSFFSRATPCLATVILAIDHIDEVLASQCVDRQYEPCIRAALAMAKKTLNKYYTLTDSSETYRIAMSSFLLLYYHSLVY